MAKVGTLTEEQLTQVLAYAGLILVAFELVKSLIVKPIKSFYEDMVFGPGVPFTSYEEDVLSRHKSEFEACLLYLRDFMSVIDSEDILAIQGLRKHRNDLAHDLAHKLHDLEVENHTRLLEGANKALFKLSNHQAYMEIGANPAFQNRGIDWDALKGQEYRILEDILDKVRVLGSRLRRGA